MFHTNTRLQCIRDLPICEFWHPGGVEPLLTPRDHGEMLLIVKNQQSPHDGLKSTGAHGANTKLQVLAPFQGMLPGPG